MKHWGIGLLLVMLIVIGVVARRQKAFMESFMEPFMESFRGKVRFNGSYPTAPVVCLAGNKRIPCTAFST